MLGVADGRGQHGDLPTNQSYTVSRGPSLYHGDPPSLPPATPGTLYPCYSQLPATSGTLYPCYSQLSDPKDDPDLLPEGARRAPVTHRIAAGSLCTVYLGTPGRKVRQVGYSDGARTLTW